MTVLKFICILFLLNSGFSPQNNSAFIQNDDQTTSQTNISQDEYYQIIIEKTEKQNQALLSTLYWSIGTIITILIAIIGTSVWYNYRFSNKEVENIITAAERKVEDLEIRMKENLREEYSTFSKQIKENLEKEISQRLSLFKDQLSAYNESYDERFENIKESIENTIKYYKTFFDQINSHVDFRVKVLENKIEKNSGRLWYLEGIKSNALSSFIRSATINNNLGWDTKYILDDILKVLKELNWINKHDFDSLNDLLSNIENNKGKVSQISELLEELEVRDLSTMKKGNPFSSIPNYSNIFTNKEKNS